MTEIANPVNTQFVCPPCAPDVFRGMADTIEATLAGDPNATTEPSEAQEVPEATAESQPATEPSVEPTEPALEPEPEPEAVTPQVLPAEAQA